ncbi:MAG TPA: metallophosphoesterase family protein [Novosphingobium sp.]|nr:metallophosphoesterase family protein [Novosphingobium sp.]HZV09642.1 metallophosphoesterase family protein [Novosphingobium sp.]
MRLGVVSDIHGQPQALARALELMGPIDRLVCLGDAINQTRFCNETVAMLRAQAALTIRGNHEDLFFAGGPTGADVDPGLAGWLAACPQRLDIALGGRRLTVVHSTPWPSGHAYVPGHHRDFHRFAVAGADVVLYGHTHQPLVRWLGPVLVVNPGSVGEGRPTPQGFRRSCALVDLAGPAARIIELD